MRLNKCAPSWRAVHAAKLAELAQCRYLTSEAHCDGQPLDSRTQYAIEQRPGGGRHAIDLPCLIAPHPVGEAVVNLATR